MRRWGVIFTLAFLYPFMGSSQSVVNYTSYWDNYLINNLTMMDDNLPNETVFGAYQSKDNFLWIVTATGLVRYDGITLKNFTAQNTSYQGSTLYEIHEDQQGNLWLPTIGEGVLKFDRTDFTHYNQQHGLNSDLIKSLAVSKGDTIWIGTYGNGLNAMYNDSIIATYNRSDGLINDYIWKILIDQKNRLWIATNNGLSIYENGQFKNFTTENGLPFNVIRGLNIMDNGEIWVGTDKEGFVVFNDLEIIKTFTQKDGASGSNPQHFAQNPEDGSIWIAYHGNGVDRYHNGVFENISSTHGLASNFTTYITFTREGLALIGTEKGLSILKKRKMDVISDKLGGLTGNTIVNVNQDSTGTVWVGTDGNGFNYSTEEGWKVIESPPAITNGYASGAAVDRSGDIWFNTKGTGIVRIRDFEIIESYTTDDGLLSGFVRAIAFDFKDNAWIGTNEGLNVIRSDGSIERFTPEDNGVPREMMLSATTISDGSVWMASFGGGIIRIKNEMFTVIDTTDGLPSNKIFDIYEDRTGTIWIGGSFDGLSMYKNGNLNTFTPEDGLPTSGFNSILEDDLGNLWLAGSSRIFKISIDDIYKYQNGTIPSISYSQYSMEDGFPSMSLQIGYNSTATKLKNGQLLFSTMDGVGVIEPTNFVDPVLAIETYIDEILVDGKPVDFTNQILIRPENNRLEITYSAYNYLAPEKTLFRVKLEGIDNDWVFMDKRKTVYYDFLPDGDYEFRVSATNSEGQWKSQNTQLSFKVLPPFYKTWWFFSLSIFGFALAVGSVVRVHYKIKMNKLNRELAVQHKIQNERERISRDLHDNVGAQITNLITGLEIGNLHLQKNHKEKALSVLQHLDSEAKGAMTELRETIWLLDQDEIPFVEFVIHVRDYLKRQQYCLEGFNVSFKNNSVPSDIAINPAQSLHLFRIIQEAVNNSRKHSKADSILISTEAEDNHLKTTIRDNGTGFKYPDAKISGNGLNNIEHRTNELNGTLIINSIPGDGTTLIISFPFIP